MRCPTCGSLDPRYKHFSDCTNDFHNLPPAGIDDISSAINSSAISLAGLIEARRNVERAIARVRGTSPKNGYEISTVVRKKNDGPHMGDVGLIISRSFDNPEIYTVMFPGDPVPLSVHSDDLEIIKNVPVDWWEN